ncbi:MAG: hypothetical protein JNL82_36060 [Myxococcales bacterium]|nr:hypothetical protein [Myxococcales bacterium]
MALPSVEIGPVPAWRFVPAREAVMLQRWDAEFSVKTRAVGTAWRSLGDLGAEVSEGLRPERASGPEPLLFRPSHLVDGLVMPDAEHLATAPVCSSRAVGPGDVVVSKFQPPRVGLVIPAVPRHVPDANCLRIIGLRPEWALWLTALFTHPGFAAHLGRQSSGSTLPRVGARDLAEMLLPPMPAEVSTLVPPWLDASEILLNVQRELGELRREALALADETAPLPPDPGGPTWIPADEMPDTWAPDQAALARYQLRLARAGWLPLARFLPTDPARLREHIPPARVLHLGDATGDLGFHLPEMAPVRPPWFRLYADPMRPGEVLLSTLGSAPKVVLNEPACPSTVWLSDQWARLDGGPNAGALALLLETRQVAWQLASATTGAVRQFIGREELAEVRVPAPPAAAAASLHRRVVALVGRRREAVSRLAELRALLASLVTQGLEGVA